MLFRTNKTKVRKNIKNKSFSNIVFLKSSEGKKKENVKNDDICIRAISRVINIDFLIQDWDPLIIVNIDSSEQQPYIFLLYLIHYTP